MSLSLREILTELAHTVGRAHLAEHIAALPLDGADAQGETDAEKLAKRNPLSSDEQALYDKLKARQDANAAAVAEDAKPADPPADNTPEGGSE